MTAPISYSFARSSLRHSRQPHLSANCIFKQGRRHPVGVQTRRVTSKPLPPPSCKHQSHDFRQTTLFAQPNSDLLRSVSQLPHFLATQNPPSHHTPGTSPLQSSTSSWVTALLAAFITSTVAYSIYSQQSRRQPLSALSIIDNSAPVKAAPPLFNNCSKMPAELLPGRPGTLTPAEEEKLREFWIAVLQVFGVLAHNVLNGEAHTEPGASTPKSDAAKGAKKKKLGLFRKKHQDDTDSPTSATSNVADAEDKYGQTKEYQDALANQSPESLRATFWSMVKHDHPDALLLRFLRARKWDVEKALVMMVSTMRWRSEDMHVDDDIIKNGEAGAFDDISGSDPAKKKLAEDFLTQMRMGKSFLHGLDKDDRPMCFVRARLHKAGEQSEQSLERYTVYVIETARMILSPPVDTACIVFDLSGFSMANMDYAPVKFMIKCFEANYPESLGVVLVHKAPWIFQGVWKIIRGWLDPVVASKVQFTNNESELEVFVPRSRIISELHGSEEWTYKYIEPVPGENDKMKDTETRDRLIQQRSTIVDEFEKCTLDWIHGDGEIEGVKQARNEIANRLREDYWVLDPYIRARSFYDRTGIINPGGKLQFYPPVAPAVSTNGGVRISTSADDID